MAQSVVGSLFGPSPEDLRRERMQTDAIMSQNAARISPYYGAGYNVGMALGRGVEALFGLQDPSMKRATAMSQALQVAQESLPAEQRGSKAALFSKVAEVLGESPDFQREALEAQVMAKDFGMEEESKAITMEYNKALTARQNIEIEQEKRDQQGSVAYGAMKALDKAKDPAAQTKIWENTLTALGQKGLDLEVVKDLPWEERKTFLESVVDSSMTGKERLAQDKLQAEMQFKLSEQARKEAHDRMMANIAERRDEMRWQISQAQIAGADRRALFNLEAQAKKLDDSLLKMQEGFRLETRKTAVNKVGLTESNKSVRSYIAENYDIDPKEAAKNVEVANNYIRANLIATNKDGTFKYPDEATAFEAAMDQFAKERIGTEKGFFKDKKVITKEPVKSSGYSKAEQGWIDRAKELNPGLSEADIIAQGKSSGKLK